MRKMWVLLLLAVTMKAFLVWYGYDRMPMVPSNDEAILNDPALSLSRGLGYVAPSYGDLFGFDRVYAHFPPVYILAQSALFHFFGFSVFTLRVLNIACYLLAFLVFFALLDHEVRRRHISDTSAFWTGLLILADPTAFMWARQGRPDFLMLLLVLLAFYSMGFARSQKNSDPFMVLSGCLMGLALGTHLQALFYLPIWAGCLWIILTGRKTCIRLGTLLLIPPAVFGLIWVGVYRLDSWEAWKQMRWITSSGLDPFANLSRGSLAVRSILTDPVAVFKQGFFLLSMTLFGVSALLVVSVFRSRDPRRLMEPKSVLALMTILSFMVCFFTMDFTLSRIVTVSVMGWASLAVFFSLLKKRAVIFFAAPIVIAGLCLHIFYIAELHRSWGLRDPGRYGSWIAGVGRDKKVAAPSAFWYEFASQKRPLRVLEFGLRQEKRYWTQHSDSLKQFDLIVLEKDHPLTGSEYLKDMDHEIFSAGPQDYRLYAVPNVPDPLK